MVPRLSEAREPEDSAGMRLQAEFRVSCLRSALPRCVTMVLGPMQLGMAQVF